MTKHLAVFEKNQYFGLNFFSKAFINPLFYYFVRLSMKKLLLFLVCCYATSAVYAQKLELGGTVSLLTKENFEAYSKPLFTSMGQSFNSNLWTTAVHEDRFKIGLDFSFMAMLIPESQKNYTAALPSHFSNPQIARTAYNKNGVETVQPSTVEQPTFYGSTPTTVYSIPQDQNGNYTYQSIGGNAEFPSGNGLNAVLGIPAVQIMMDLPSRTHVRLRVVPVPSIDDDMNVFYGMISVGHQFNQYIDPLKDSTLGISLNAAYSLFSITNVIDANALAIGINASKKLNEYFTVFGGIQYEDFSGTFTYVRKDVTPNEASSNTPYDEVRENLYTNNGFLNINPNNGTYMVNNKDNRKPVVADISTFSNVRIVAGGEVHLKALQLHAQVAYLSQFMFSGGFSVWFN